MFEALKRLFRYKRSEFEAHLNPTPDCMWGGVGEVEVELWSDGAVQIDASIKHSGAPDGTELEVHCAGRPVTTLLVNGGYAKVYVDSGDGSPLPEVGMGAYAELRHEGKALYRGQFHRD